MAIDDQLTGFVKEGLAQGLPRARLEEALLQAGWPAEQVKGAMAGFADVSFPLPVPRPRRYLSAREAFTYLILFSTLYVSAFSFGSLIFELINRGFPDPAIDPEFAAMRGREAIRWAISFLVVTFPVFVLVSRANHRSLVANPTKRLSAVRRWLTYLTLFVASGFLVGDMTGVVYNLLSGEITVRFLLKVLTVAAIAGTVFAYLVREVRNDEEAA